MGTFRSIDELIRALDREKALLKEMFAKRHSLQFRYDYAKEKKSFDAFYFPYANSYIVYEVMRENGAYCVVALKSQGRVMFRFVDAAYDSRWFLDEHRQVYGEWTQIRAQVGTKHQISSLVSSYEMYRDIIFGNNRRQELLPYRKFAIVESSKYQNIPRTIQNVFLNTKLDADFIKHTIIQSMSDENVFIDLTFYREQIKEFEQEYKDVSLWTEKNRNGEIVVRRIADKVIECYRSLLNSRRLIREGRKELNYAERVAQELLPQYVLDIQKSEAERDSLLRKKAEEQGKYDKERDRLTRDIGVLDAQLKKTAEKRRHYDDIRIADILHRVEQEQALAEERKRQEAMKAELEKSYQNVVDKYKALFDQIDMDLRAYINNKDRLVNEHREQFVAKKDRMMRELRKAEDESRHLAKDSTDNMQAVIAQLTTEETALKIQKAKVGSENPFAKDMDANEREHAELLAHKTQVETDVREHEQSIDTMRKEAERALEIAELKYQSSLAEPQKHKADVEAEIQQLQTLLEKTKGSFAEWLDNNKKGWQETIGKVVDEESILYNNVLNPQLVPSSAATSLYGVSINLAAVERKFRTPEELRALANEKSEECAVCVKRLNELQCRHEDGKKTLTAKYQSQIRKKNEELAALKAELMLVPQQEKAIKMQSVELKNKLDDWRKRQIAELDERHNAVIAERVNKEEAKRHVEAELQRKLKSLQAEYNRLLKAEQDVLDKFVSEKEQLTAEKMQQVALRKEDLQKAQFDELHGKGMDTSALDAYNRRIAELDKELDFIRQHRDEVAVYRNDKVELFDTEPSVRQERKSKAEALSQLESKFRQYRERIELQLGMVQDKQNKQKAELKNLESGLDAAKVFRSDETLCPIGSNEVAEKTTTKGCKAIVEELKSRIYSNVKSLDNFKRQAQQFLGMFSAHNTFHFNVSPVTEEEYFAFAANLCEFVENDKISEYQKRISARYTDIILRISKEMGDLTSREGAIVKTINDINRDFEERNFAGVIREIALRPVKTSDQLMFLLLRIKEFSDENQYNMGEMDLFATESRQDVNAKAVKYLLAFMKGLLDEPNRKQLQVADNIQAGIPHKGERQRHGMGGEDSQCGFRWYRHPCQGYGEFDLAGIHIYLSEFYAYLGERSSFLIPPDIDERLSRGNSVLYNQQYAKFRDMKVTDVRLKPLMDMINRHRKGYEQEGYIDIV